MAAKVVVPNPNRPGTMTEGELIGVESIKENWNEYLLVDGTRLRMRLIVHDVARLAEQNEKGEPIYVVRSSNILEVDVPPALKVRGSN